MMGADAIRCARMQSVGDVGWPADISAAIPVATKSGLTQFSNYVNSITTLDSGAIIVGVGRQIDRVGAYQIPAGLAVDSAVAFGSTLDVTAQTDWPYGLAFSEAGNRMLVAASGLGSIYFYTLSSPADPGSATYDGLAAAVTSPVASLQDIHLVDDSKLYISCYTTRRVYEFDVDLLLGTISYAGKSLDVSAFGTQLYSFWLSPDKQYAYVLIGSTDMIYQLSLATAGDIESAIYDGVSLSVGAQMAIAFSDDGASLFTVDHAGLITQYSL